MPIYRPNFIPMTSSHSSHCLRVAFIGMRSHGKTTAASSLLRLSDEIAPSYRPHIYRGDPLLGTVFSMAQGIGLAIYDVPPLEDEASIGYLLSMIDELDLIFLIVDISKPMTDGLLDEIYGSIKGIESKIIIIANKCDNTPIDEKGMPHFIDGGSDIAREFEKLALSVGERSGIMALSSLDALIYSLLSIDAPLSPAHRSRLIIAERGYNGYLELLKKGDGSIGEEDMGAIVEKLKPNLSSLLAACGHFALVARVNELIDGANEICISKYMGRVRSPVDEAISLEELIDRIRTEQIDMKILDLSPEQSREEMKAEAERLILSRISLLNASALAEIERDFSFSSTCCLDPLATATAAITRWRGIHSRAKDMGLSSPLLDRLSLLSIDKHRANLAGDLVLSPDFARACFPCYAETGYKRLYWHLITKEVDWLEIDEALPVLLAGYEAPMRDIVAIYLKRSSDLSRLAERSPTNAPLMRYRMESVCIGTRAKIAEVSMRSMMDYLDNSGISHLDVEGATAIILDVIAGKEPQYLFFEEFFCLSLKAAAAKI